jgi:anthranilate phosphoribosyltransferase
MGELLQKVVGGESLTQQEAHMAMNKIMSGEYSPIQIASFLTALRIKGETVDELVGFVEGMKEHATNLHDPLFIDAVDTCGTGGDGSNSFNISTAAAIVAAAGGVPIAKHGNRAASSKCGSADVLEALGIKIDFDPTLTKKLFERTGICFLFAPLYHPAMKNVRSIRKELGFRTCFNLLGPLTNPVGVKSQLIGVYDPSLTPLIAQVLAAFGHERALVVSSYDGFDELSITGKTRVSELRLGKVTTYELDPEQLGLSFGKKEEIIGGDPKTNAEIIRRIFEGEKGSARDIVVLNAGAVLYVADLVSDLQAGVRLAEELIDYGKVTQKLEEMIEVSKEIQYVSR